MGDNVHVRIFHRLDDPASNLVTRLAHARMYGRHHYLHAGQRLVRQVEPAVRADIYLDAGENPELTPPVQFLYLAYLPAQPFRAQAPGDAQPLRVVGNGEVLVSQHPGRLRHFLDAMAPVTPVAVGMEIALHVPGLDQARESTRFRAFYLALRLPKFRRYVLQAQPAIEVLFRGELLQHAGGHVRYAVLAELQATAAELVPQGDIVLLAAGEVLQQRAEAVMFHQAQVNLHPPAHDYRGLGRPLSQHLLHQGQAGKRLNDRFGVVRGTHDIDIADGLLKAPEASGRRQIAQARHWPERSHYIFNQRQRFADGYALVLAAQRLYLAEYVFRRLLPHAAQRCHAAIVDRPLQFVDRLYAQLG